MKMIYINTCKTIYDSPNDLIRNYMTHEYFGHDLVEVRIKKILEVTKEDVVKLAQKVKLDTVYFLKGVRHEKTDN